MQEITIGLQLIPRSEIVNAHVMLHETNTKQKQGSRTSPTACAINNHTVMSQLVKEQYGLAYL